MFKESYLPLFASTHREGDNKPLLSYQLLWDFKNIYYLIGVESKITF